MGIAEIDDSFKKPGAIPFKWETRPGVPKSDPPSESTPYIHHHHHDDGDELDVHQDDTCQSLPSTPHHLTPPPRTQSLRTPSRPRWNLLWYDHDHDQGRDLKSDPDPDPALFTQPESASVGSFLSPRLRWKWGWKKLSAKSKPKPKPKPRPDLEPKPDHVSKVENLVTRWSGSTRKSLSSFRGSPSSSSFSSSHGSSP